MANEITFAQTEGVFSQDYMLNRESLIAALHPVQNVLQLLRRSSLVGQPSDSQRFPKPPVLTASSVADGTDASNQAYSPTSVTLTVGEIVAMVTPTDLNTTSNIFGGAGQYGADLGMALADKLITDITALLNGFSTEVGSSGNPLTETIVLTGHTTLRAANVNGRLAMGLHPQQWFDLVGDVGTTISAAATTGTSPRAVTNDLAQGGDGFIGEIYGDTTVVNSTVASVNAGADRGGAMFEIGTALAYVTKWGSRLETERDASLRATEMVAGMAYAVGELDDTRGVAISTDL